MSTIEFTLSDYHVPHQADQAHDPQLIEYARFRNDRLREADGSFAEPLTPLDIIQRTATRTGFENHIILAHSAGKLLGRASYDLVKQESSDLAYLYVDVDPAFWGRGIGSALIRRAEEALRSHGRTRVQIWQGGLAKAGDDALEQLPSPAGGSLPLNHTTRFLVKHGYRLGQVELMSVFSFADSAQQLETLFNEAAEAAADDYRFICWEPPILDEHIASFARLKERMSVEVPYGELSPDVEIWDEQRVRDHDQKILSTLTSRLVGAIVHLPSGELAGYTELERVAEPSAPASQCDTYVLMSHRGHKLGQLLKAGNLLEWSRRFPETQQVVTYNAAENTHMLDINLRTGFAVVGRSGGWEKSL